MSEREGPVVLIFGSVLAWGGWELWTLRRDKARDALKQAQSLQDVKASASEPPAPGA